MGITVDPKTLDMDQVFRHDASDALLSVVPTTAADKLKFELTRAGDPLSSAAVVNAPRPYRLGLGKGGIARQYVGTHGIERIWSVRTPAITEPRVAQLPGYGPAVTFRAGDATGEIRMGWLDTSGDRNSELFTLPQDAQFVGTPTVAENGKEVLLAFSARATRESAWVVHLATAQKGKAPGRVVAFKPPGADPGEGAIAPTAAALPDGRWVLQWTEGAPGKRSVRAQVVDERLVAASDAVTLSGAETNAGQGALWPQGETVMSLFLVRHGSEHELWGASLICERSDPRRSAQ
jgi:hypothetical protein